MPSCPASATGRTSGCCATCGTFISTAKTPLALVAGSGAHLLRAFLERLRRGSRTSPFRKPTAQFYAAAYAQPGGMRAGFEYFKNFERDAKDFAQLGANEADDADAGALR